MGGKAGEHQAHVFEALRETFGTLAQLVEQRTFNPFVVGSTPAGPTKI